MTKLIDKIVVSEAYEIDGVKNYDIEINYKFIGSTASIEENVQNTA